MTAEQELIRDEEKAINAETIRQIGGSKALYMLGCKFATSEKTKLTFRIKGSKVKAFTVEYVRGIDLYNLAFYTIRKLNVKKVAEFEMVYGDQLKPLIEETTGLYLSL